MTFTASSKRSTRTRRRVVSEPGLFVVGLHPSGTEAELEAPLAQEVERRRLLGQHKGVAVVVTEDERAQAQGRRGPSDGGQGRDRGELVTEVVGHEQGRVPEVFAVTSLFGPRASSPLRSLAQLGGETEGVIWHGVIVPHFGRATPDVAPGPCGGLSRSRSRATRSGRSGSARARVAFRPRTAGIRRRSPGATACRWPRWDRLRWSFVQRAQALGASRRR